jgi:hypothetical protein
MRIVPRKVDPAQWVQHFKEQAAGVRHPSRDGYIFVGNQTGRGTGQSTTSVQLVSPVQRAVDQAKAEIKRARGIKRKASTIRRQFKKKGKGRKKSGDKKKGYL